MMSAEPGKPRWSILRRILPYVLGVVVVFVVLAALLVGPDQFRALPEIDPDSIRRVTISDMEKNTDKPEVDSDATSTSSTLPSSRNEWSSAATTPGDAARDWAACLRPVADVATLPEELRPAAQAWIDAIDRQIPELLDTIAHPEAQSRQEAMKRIGATMQAYWVARREFDAKAMALGAEGERSLQEGQQVRNKAYREWLILYDQAGLSVNMHNGAWYDAGVCCQKLGGWRTPEEAEQWWDIEVACLRRAGIEGRFELGLRSIQRAYSGWAVDHPEADGILKDWGLNP